MLTFDPGFLSEYAAEHDITEAAAENKFVSMHGKLFHLAQDRRIPATQFNVYIGKNKGKYEAPGDDELIVRVTVPPQQIYAEALFSAINDMAAGGDGYAGLEYRSPDAPNANVWLRGERFLAKIEAADEACVQRALKNMRDNIARVQTERGAHAGR